MTHPHVQAAIDAANRLSDAYSVMLVGGPQAGFGAERTRRAASVLPHGFDPFMGLLIAGLPWATSAILMAAWQVRTRRPVVNGDLAVSEELDHRRSNGPPMFSAPRVVVPRSSLDHAVPRTAKPYRSPASPDPTGFVEPVPQPEPVTVPIEPAAEQSLIVQPSAVPPVPPKAPSSEPPAEPPPEPRLPIPAPPEYLAPEEREAWIQARTRAGEFCRGLGNAIGAEFDSLAREVWAGETPTHVPNPEQRAGMVEEIRKAVARGVAEGLTPEKVASVIGHATGDWSRDLVRIARTELRGAYNDGVILHAHRVYGADARVAVVPPPDACETCVRVTMANGDVIVWSIEALLANGTNVGAKKADAKCTAWPIHPNCHCRVRAVPPGFTFKGRSMVRSS